MLKNIWRFIAGIEFSGAAGPATRQDGMIAGKSYFFNSRRDQLLA